MMTKFAAGSAFILGLCALPVSADKVSASSHAFSFPAFTAVKQGTVVAHPSYFKFLQNPAGARVMTFMWSFPAQPAMQRGSITVYSLRGQAVKSFPFTGSSGMVKWNAAKDGAPGIYVARLVYGSVRQNIRMMLCN